MSQMWTVVSTIFVLVSYTLGVLSALHAVMNNRSSQGAIAWVFSLALFPFIALPLYWFFGRNEFAGYVTLRQASLNEVGSVVQKMESELTPYLTDATDKYRNIHTIEKLASLPLVTGNNVELLINGDATFTSIIEGIKEAQKFLLVQFYIVEDDAIGLSLQKAMIERAQAGVEVYFLYDRVGSSKISKPFLKTLKEGGVTAYDFNAKRGPKNRFKLNFRNHRKIVIVDGLVSWVGGHNVSDDYVGKGKLGPWRDTHVKVSGPAVLGTQLSFLEDWHWATNEVLNIPWNPKVPEDDGAPVLFIPSGPADLLETASLMFVHAIHAAKERIWIATPYFVPDDAVVAALQLAGLRGIDVRILVPDNPDQYLVYAAAFTYFKSAMDTGVKFYRYQEGFMHQKVMLVDNSFAAVGTANLDNRSLRLNFEITTCVFDPGFNAEVSDMFELDFEKSRLMVSDEYEERSFYFKLLARLAALFSPIL